MILTLALPEILHAQGPGSGAGITLSRAGSKVASVKPGTSVTGIFSVRNGSGESVSLVPRFTTPAGWNVVIGGAPFAVQASASETYLVSVGVPARAAAGRYVIGVALDVARRTDASVSDSIVVEIEERRAVDVRVVDSPPYVMAGAEYVLGFTIFNRGNSRSAFRVLTVSSTSRLKLVPGMVTLGPGESEVVRVPLVSKNGADRAIDDLVEMRVAHVADTMIRSEVSVRTTIVPQAGDNRALLTVPTQIRLRAASKYAGVSPFEISGGGSVRDGGPETMSFFVRGPAGKFSSFGDRDEYRAELQTARLGLRVGDQNYSLSQVMSPSQTGLGGSADLRAGKLGAGAYGTRFRYVPGAPTEFGGYVGLRQVGRDAASQISLNAVSRPNGPLAGNLLGALGKIAMGDSWRGEAEYALSNSSHGTAGAGAFRLVGSVPFHFQLGHTQGDDAFAGPARGTLHDFVTMSGTTLRKLQLNASATRHRNRSLPGLAFNEERFNTAGASAAWGGLFSVEYLATQQSSRFDGGGSRAREWGVITRTAGSIGRVGMWASGEGGRGRDITGIMRGYSELSGGATVDFRGNTISAYANLYDGGSINRGPVPFLNVGGYANLRLPLSTTLSMTAYHSSPRDSVSPKFTQVDTRVTKMLAFGSSVGVRLRQTMQAGARTSNIGFAEYSMPIGLPVGYAKPGGRVVGRVVDSETGRGIPGTLVRLGPQAAITDRDGRVYFNGLPVGDFRVSLAQSKSGINDILLGDAAVRVDSSDRRPATFSLQVDRPATVTGVIREMIVARTGVGAEPDSLVESAPVADVTVALTNGIDTVYRITDEEGRFEMSELAPGRWTAVIADEPPALKRYEPTYPMELGRGEKRELVLRLVPVRRRVQILNEQTVPIINVPPVRK